jgi:hypothetical protein
VGALDPETARLLASFEAGTLAALPHADHVRIGWAYARTSPLLDAIAKMRTGLVRFATAHGAAEKYHETITWAFTVLIHERIARAPELGWEAFVAENPDLFDAGALRRYYSKETLGSPLARKVFVLPDSRGA